MIVIILDAYDEIIVSTSYRFIDVNLIEILTTKFLLTTKNFNDCPYD